MKIFYRLLCFFIAFMTTELCAESTKYPFGRLFTQPEERILVDKKRGSLFKEDNKVDDKATNKLDKQGLSVSGILLRSDGQNMLWIDGKSVLSKRGGDDNVQGLIDPATGLSRVQWGYKTRSLKPGQAWDFGTDTLFEAFELTRPLGGSSIIVTAPLKVDSLK